jgi:hypothetical protein
MRITDLLKQIAKVASLIAAALGAILAGLEASKPD